MPGAPFRINELGRPLSTPFFNLCAYSVPAFEKVSAVDHFLDAAQSETTGVKVGFSTGEVAQMDAQIEAVWKETVEEEVNRRLAARGVTVEVQQTDMGHQQIRNGRNGHTLLLTFE